MYNHSTSMYSMASQGFISWAITHSFFRWADELSDGISFLPSHGCGVLKNMAKKLFIGV